MTPMTGAPVSLTVYSGPPAEVGVRRSPTPSARASTMTTPWPPDAMLAGTRIHRAAAAYGTPTLVPVTVPESPDRLAVVAGSAGISAEGRSEESGGGEKR